MKVQFPKGTPSMSVGGKTYEADEHGQAEMEVDHFVALQSHGAEAVAEDAEDDSDDSDNPLVVILKGNVDKVKSAIFNEDEPLTDEQLIELEQLEQLGSARKGVLDAIAAEQTAREEAED